MGLRVSTLAKSMVSAAKDQLAEKWPEVRIYAESEARKLAQTLVMIEKLKLADKISKRQAELLLDMQKQTSRVVLLTIEGLSLLAAESAINAAIRSIRDAANDAIGWKLI